MRKQIIDQQMDTFSANQEWLDLNSIAYVELTSEDPAYPIESALVSYSGQGWKAIKPGEQTIRLLFVKPIKIHRIRLVFEEKEKTRTQQFTLRWSNDDGQIYREIVCQQYNFDPQGANYEIENYYVDLEKVTIFEIKIAPDINDLDVCASLKQLQLG